MPLRLLQVVGDAGDARDAGDVGDIGDVGGAGGATVRNPTILIDIVPFYLISKLRFT